MEGGISRRYETRKRTMSTEMPKSRVDWKRTKINPISYLLDTDEEDQDSSIPDNELPEDPEEGTQPFVSVSDHTEENTDKSSVSVDVEEDCIITRKRKRASSTVLYDSDSDSDVCDIPVRKLKAKRRHFIDDDDDEFSLSAKWDQNTDDVVVKEEDSADEKEETSKRRRNRLLKLKALSKERRSRGRTSSGYFEGSDEELYQLPMTPIETSSDDDESLKDFIVDDDDDDEEEKEHNDDEGTQGTSSVVQNSAVSLSRLRIPLYGSRWKKYAQDMLTSLYHLDDRIIQPRLENLVTRSRWRERYKERVQCYPHVQIIMKEAVNASCDACELHRYCRFKVVLSGQQYNKKTLETDDFMSNDKQALFVGRVCADRTLVYHNLNHFKHHLYQQCCSVVEGEADQDEPVKDTVKRLFAQLQDDGWIQEQYDILEKYLHEADYFQEEKLD
ncbi:coiled-coil domain-containing protein 82 isoform X2 [Latimeria chalumnae]|uniref:coiled-coil domain-containing protein 82 isoform X2 n=1 Tax=Latimeria chalumnae TaxID=7897 RepID=UPI00313D4201